MKSKRPGQDWPDVNCSDVDANTIRERVRASLAYILLASAATFDILSAAYGFSRGDWEALRVALFYSWTIIFAVLGWYFGRGAANPYDEGELANQFVPLPRGVLMASQASPKPKNISLGPDAQARLDSLKNLSGASSHSEVIRNALRYYEFLLKESKKGSHLVVKRPSGDEASFPIL